jgi:hypothetical protein
MQDKIAAAQLMKLVDDDDDDVAARSFLGQGRTTVEALDGGTVDTT